MRLIDADKLNARLSRNGTPYYTVPDIENAPTVDAAPIRHGRWVQKKEWHLGRWVAWFECSECGEHDDNSDMYEMIHSAICRIIVPAAEQKWTRNNCAAQKSPLSRRRR